MLKTHRWANLAIIGLFLAFGYGAARLYLLRFGAGDVYAPYSTLRTDPLGAKALYESLQELPELSVSRNVQELTLGSIKRTIGNRAVTLMMLGTDAHDPDHAPLDFVRAAEEVMRHGGRVVIAFAPTTENLRDLYEEMEARRLRSERSKRDRDDEDQEASESDKSEKGSQEDSDDNEDNGSPYDAYFMEVDLPERWGVKLEFDPVERTADNRMKTEWARRKGAPGLPSEVSWHTATSFDELDDTWQVIYESNGKAVLIERPFGEGSLVMSSDSYYLSNEALRAERHPELLAWLAGPNRTIIFDESHLGVVRSEGIMTLARAYGLHGVFGVLLAMALLYVWKNAVAFVPAYEDDSLTDARHAKGKDSAAGFANLIRRGVEGRNLLHTCLEEYKRSLGHRQRELREPLERMQAIADEEHTKTLNEWNPVNAYQAMSRVLAEYLGRRR